MPGRRGRADAYPVPHQSTLARTVPYLAPRASRSTPALPRRPARPSRINRHDVTSWRSGPQQCYIVAVVRVRDPSTGGAGGARVAAGADRRPAATGIRRWMTHQDTEDSGRLGPSMVATWPDD